MIVLPKNLNATKINLIGLNLKEIPQEVFKYKNLRKLFLQNNRIGRIPQEINQLKLLTTIDISNNNLTSLHAKIFDLKRLEVLILNNNKIKNIPSQIKKLKRLRILGLANNKFVTLNAHLNFLTELKELNLSGNGFVEFPLEIFNQKNLERLWFCNYDFDIPNFSFFKKELPHLKKLYKSSVMKIESKKIKHIMASIDTKKSEMLKNNFIIEKPKKIFISYSHQDKDWLERVKKHIKVLSMYTESDFEVWDDKRINAGDNWKAEIKNALRESTAAILLISTDFLASDFIKNDELQPLLNMAKEKGTRILSLILSPCRFLKISSLNKFQSVNNPTTEILSKQDKSTQDEILERLTDEVENHLNSKISDGTKKSTNK